MLYRLGYVAEVDRPLGLPVVRALRGFSRILEIGTGPPGWSWRRLLAPVRLSEGVGLDAHLPYLRPDAMSWSARVWGRGERLPFRDRVFDAAIALDVLEHLEKVDGLRLLEEMERVSRFRSVVVTPNGFLPQESVEVPTQAHRSGWTPAELSGRGYRVRGIRGWRRLRGDHSKVVIRPAWFGHFVSGLTEPLVWWGPGRAFQLLAIKDVGVDPAPSEPLLHAAPEVASRS